MRVPLNDEGIAAIALSNNGLNFLCGVFIQNLVCKYYVVVFFFAGNMWMLSLILHLIQNHLAGNAARSMKAPL